VHFWSDRLGETKLAPGFTLSSPSRTWSSSCRSCSYLLTVFLRMDIERIIVQNDYLLDRSTPVGFRVDAAPGLNGINRESLILIQPQDKRGRTVAQHDVAANSVQLAIEACQFLLLKFAEL